MHFVKLNIYTRVYIKKKNVHARVSRHKEIYSQAYTAQKKKKKNAQASICTEIKLAAVDAVAFRKQGDMYT